ncbi:MAG TPA: glycosyltransferase [Xanthobacteraceae bacterium]|nr:glycosyltransferase [Xanthobacteraceae bacterium]
MKIAFFGSSLTSSYWNGAATYYRGLLKALNSLGHDISFYEPDAFDRQRHRDIADPDWAKVIVYPATSDGWRNAIEEAARHADLIVKASGIGVFDRELECAVPAASGQALTVFWDVDAPATLESIAANPDSHMRKVIPQYDLVLTYGGGSPVMIDYEKLGARLCVPIYNAVDPESHHPASAQENLACTLSFLGNRMPDRETRVDEFFVKAAAITPNKQFLLGGAGWDSKQIPRNVRYAGHIGTADHNAFFCSSKMTLNINRESMARYGFSPPTRIFEAAGSGTCVVTDTWEGIELFFDPGAEILCAKNGEDVASFVETVSSARATRIGHAAMRRALAEHTYINRAREVAKILDASVKKNEAAA